MLYLHEKGMPFLKELEGSNLDSQLFSVIYRSITMRAAKLSIESSIESLRNYYHSIHDSERAEVIELLSAMKDPEASRELIQLYAECEWRGTKFLIIQALERNPSQRGLEFLFRLARQLDDISLAEAAIRSLGQTHHRLAALFLVNYYPRCHEGLKPALIGALGQIPDRTLIADFLAVLPKAIQAEQVLLARNLVVTLGELKVSDALPHLIEIALQKKFPTNAICALIAIGKISRDVKILDDLENRFRDDLFENQIFSSVKVQIQFRSQWKLEDYLSQIFENNNADPTLSFELTHFSETDVSEGLKLFLGEQYFEQLCFVLGKLNFPNSANLYESLIDVHSLIPAQKTLIYQSMSQHRHPDLNRLLLILRESDGDTVNQWLEAVTLCLPEAEKELKTFFESLAYRDQSEDKKMSAINSLYNYALVVQTSPERLQEMSRIFDNLLITESSLEIQSRIIRALARLEIKSKKAGNFIRKFFDHLNGLGNIDGQHVSNLISSSLLYLELCPDKMCTPSLLNLMDLILEKTLESSLKVALIRSLSSLSALPGTKLNKIEAFLKVALESYESDEVLSISALKFLKLKPLDGLLTAVIGCLKGGSRVQLATIITLKSYQSEIPVERVGEFLNSQLQSLSGRALDTLIFLPGMRAKIIVFDFLKRSASDLEVCDKVIRCFKVPEIQSDYFLKIVNDILRRFPQHELLDGLIALKEKLSYDKERYDVLGCAPRSQDIEVIDRQLSVNIIGYPGFDEFTKSALRSAELPYQHPEMFGEYVDKGSSVIEYSKAIDLVLEKELGEKLIFPKLELGLHEFQNLLHFFGFHDESPSAHFVLRQMGLEGHFNVQTLPLRKMVMIAHGIRTGRIVNEQFKILDGLRAWAIMLLLFARRIQGAKMVIRLQNSTDDQVISFSKRLIKLQDIRNPLAHRQTIVKFIELDGIRKEVFSLLNAFQKMI